MHPIQKAPPFIHPEGVAAPTKESMSRDAKSLKKSAQDFEAIFIQSMFKAMRKTIPDGGMFEKDTAHEIYQDMLDSEVAREISKHQSMGLAEQLYRQMEKYLPDSQKK